MNMLNSVLIEGRAYLVQSRIDGSVDFRLESIRYNKKEDGGEESQKTEVTVFVPASRLADYCVKSINPNTMLRVVGRLISAEGKTIILAEHIEVRVKR